MAIELRLLAAGGEVTRYGQGLLAATRQAGMAISLNTGRPWWQKKSEWTIGLGTPTASRRIDAWIWLNGTGASAAKFHERPVAVAALYPLAPPGVGVVPFPVPEAFYAPGDGQRVFDVTKRLHLEQRPRIVMMGPFSDGRGLTQTMTAMVRLLASGGELVWLEGMSVRAQFAPVVSRLGLVDRVIFLPPLTDEETAAVLLGSDVALLPERQESFPYWIPWCHAAGVPVVAVDTASHRLAAGTAAVLADGEREDGLGNALKEVLSNAAMHRQLVTRGMNQAEFYRWEKVALALEDWVSKSRDEAKGYS